MFASRLKPEDGAIQFWLSPTQAERLAADIFSYRFALPDIVVVDRPPQWKKKPNKVFISFRTTMSRELGPRPSLDSMRDSKDPATRKQHAAVEPALKKRQAAWDRQAAKRNAKLRAERDKLVGGGFGPKRR